MKTYSARIKAAIDLVRITKKKKWDFDELVVYANKYKKYKGISCEELLQAIDSYFETSS